MSGQTTLNKPFSLIGRHPITLDKYQVDFRPTKAGTGKVFITNGNKIKPTIYNTNIYRKIGLYAFITEENGANIKVSEHLHALLYALNVQNIEIDFGKADTVPIFGNKDLDLVKKINDVGLHYFNETGLDVTIKKNWSDPKLSINRNGNGLFIETHVMYKELGDEELVNRYEITPETYRDIVQSRPYMRVSKNVFNLLTSKNSLSKMIRSFARNYYNLDTDFSEMLKDGYLEKLSELYLFHEEITNHKIALNAISDHTAVDRGGIVGLSSNSFEKPAIFYLEMITNRSNHLHDIATWKTLFENNLFTYK